MKLSASNLQLLFFVVLITSLLCNVGLGVIFINSKNEINDLKEKIKQEDDDSNHEISKYKLDYNVPNPLENKGSMDDAILVHSIPFEHADACDFTGQSKTLFNFTDFRVTIKVYNRNFQETALINENEFVLDNYLKEDGFKIDNGFIEEFSTESLEGYRISEGVEGCGEDRYYFTIDNDNTLFITWKWIMELSGMLPQEVQEEYMKLEGVISPEEAELLFNEILASIEIDKVN